MRESNSPLEMNMYCLFNKMSCVSLSLMTSLFVARAAWFSVSVSLSAPSLCVVSYCVYVCVCRGGGGWGGGVMWGGSYIPTLGHLKAPLCIILSHVQQHTRFERHNWVKLT